MRLLLLVLKLCCLLEKFDFLYTLLRNWGSLGAICNQKWLHLNAIWDLMWLLFVFEIGSPVLGVGFTGSLATSRLKLGDHRYIDL